MIIINSVIIHYSTNITECDCSLQVSTPFGQTVVNQNIRIPSGDLSEDWTDLDLCGYVAGVLGVLVEEVSVATPPVQEIIPEPPAEEPVV